MLNREKLRPTPPLQPRFREKVRPARHKPPIFGHFSHAGRTFSRSHPPSDRAGRTFSRTGHSHVATVKPPSPMQPKNASKTPISHPQRRWRFHAGDLRCPRAMAGPGRATSGRPTLQTDQKSTRKTPPIDDVCNNTQRSAPKSQHDKPEHIWGPENPAVVPVGWWGLGFLKSRMQFD